MTSSLALASRTSGLPRLYWRVHSWAGLVLAPLLLFAAATGLFYVWTPTLEQRVYAALDRVPVGAQPQPLDAQIAAVRAALPDWPIASITPAATPEASTQVWLRPPPPPHSEHAGHAPPAAGHDHGLPQGRIAYVDPYRATLLGTLDEMDRWRTWSKKLHASFLQGNAWRWPMELAASWGLLMVATGLALWWPPSRARHTSAGARPPAAPSGRPRWRDWHAWVGLASAAVLLVLLVTGLTWSRHAGDHFRRAMHALGQHSPQPPAALHSAPPVGGAAALSAQAVHERAVALAGGQAVQLTPPRAADRPWRADVLLSTDHARPTRRLTLLIDAYDGRERYRSGWKELPLLAKATALGIPFHRGELGLWNRVLLACVALALMFSVISGLRMWWLRRALRHRRASQPPRPLPWWLWALTAALALALPVFGLSLLALGTLDGLTRALPRRRAHA